MRRAKGRPSRPSTWRGCTWSCAGMSRRRSRSGRTSTRSAGWPPTTTGSGWGERTWRSGSARSMRRRGGSTPASGRRPDDPSVWRARLDWAMRTNRLADVRAALKHLPAESATPAEVHRLSAWLASACGDVERERRELAALVAEAPEDFEALERLEKLEPREAADTVAADLRRPEGGDRTRPGAVSRALSPQPAGARRRGDGPPGRTAGPPLRGDRLPDRRDRRGAGPRRPAGGLATRRGGREPAGRSRPKLVRPARDRWTAARTDLGNRIGRPEMAFGLTCRSWGRSG